MGALLNRQKSLWFGQFFLKLLNFYSYSKRNLYIYPFFVFYIPTLEWVKCLKFPKINGAEIVDESSQNKVVEFNQTYIHMPD